MIVAVSAIATTTTSMGGTGGDTSITTIGGAVGVGTGTGRMGGGDFTSEFVNGHGALVFAFCR